MGKEENIEAVENVLILKI